MGRSEHLQAGLRALQAAELDEALHRFEAVLARSPDNVDALYLSGVTLAGLGQVDRGVERLTAAIARQPERAPLHYNLGKLFQDAGRLDEAEVAYRAAIALQPEFAEALANLGLVVKERGETVEASACFQRRFRLRKARESSPVDEESTLFTTRMKLRHDIEQLDHLAQGGAPIEGIDRIRDALVQVLQDLETTSGAAPDDASLALTPAHQRALADSHNRDLYLEEGATLPPGAVFSPRLDAEGVQDRYLGTTPRICVVDDFLSAETLAALRRHCMDSTFWYSDRYQGGYLGAYWEEGFGSPLLVQIAQEMRAVLPQMLAQHPLQQMWAYKYDCEGGGIGVHADSAAVNVNFWITPDSANLDPDSGGLVVHHVRAPREWDHAAYNSRDSEARIEALIAAEGGGMTRVPYRANRAVIFDSDLFHRTDRYRFRPGYENRRINVTMLFGWREGNR